MSDVPQKLNVGDVIGGRFEVLTDMGENELGQTCLVRDTGTLDKFLVKKLSFACDEAYVAEIQSAVEEFKKIDQKSLATVHEFIVEGTTGYILMEYINGETFESHLALRRERGQILGIKAAYSFLAHLCLGIEAIHNAGYVYGCLSPKTVFVTQQGRIRIVNYICSWIAERFLDDEKRNAYFGGAFCAPEIRTERYAATPVSDVYSLALLFADLLSNNAFETEGIAPNAFISNLHNVSDNAKEALYHATMESVSERFQNVTQLKDSLKNAVDAPSDKDLSSIVVGVNDLRALTVSADMPIIDVNAAKPKKPDLFDSPATKPSHRSIRTSVWIYQKDGMDYGPFDHNGVIEKLYQDVIDEATSFYNTQTKKRQNFGSIEEFQEELRNWIPIRENNRAIKMAELKKKENLAKGSIGGAVFLAAGIVAAIFIVPIIILAMLPDPKPLDTKSAFNVFEKEFNPPKPEEYTVNVDDSRAKALFNSKATQAELEAAYKKWEEENKKKNAKHHGSGGAKTAPGEMIDTLVFGTDEDGKELEPLMDWEVEAQLDNPRFQYKVSQCIENHSNGRAVNGKLNFTIQQTGSIINVNTTFNDDLDKCIRAAAASIKYRSFGGTVKKVTLPISYN